MSAFADNEEQPKKVILCYGDSNTWGSVPAGNGARWPSNVRWPGVLSKLLRTNYRIVEEGLGGRTTVHDDPLSLPWVERNGIKTFGALLESHKPLDLAIVFLGTNDLKKRFSVPAVDIAAGVEMVATIANNPMYGPGNGKPPAVLAICPPAIWEVQANFGGTFKGGRERSQHLRQAFYDMSKRSGLPVMFAADFVHSDPADGIHLSAESHGLLGQEVAKWILERLPA